LLATKVKWAAIEIWVSVQLPGMQLYTKHHYVCQHTGTNGTLVPYVRYTVLFDFTLHHTQQRGYPDNPDCFINAPLAPRETFFLFFC
jgi:hypothetical protein